MSGVSGTSMTHDKTATQRNDWEIAASEKGREWFAVCRIVSLARCSYLLIVLIGCSGLRVSSNHYRIEILCQGSNILLIIFG